MRHFLLLATAAVLTATPALAQTVDRAQVARLIDEGIAHSDVMPIAAHLSDVIGPRMTNSPAMRQAEAWTQAKFTNGACATSTRKGSSSAAVGRSSVPASAC